MFRFAKTRMEFQIPMHPHWHHIIENVSPINGAVRRSLHDLLGGYLDLPDAEDASYWYQAASSSPDSSPQTASSSSWLAESSLPWDPNGLRVC